MRKAILILICLSFVGCATSKDCLKKGSITAESFRDTEYYTANGDLVEEQGKDIICGDSRSGYRFCDRNVDKYFNKLVESRVSEEVKKNTYIGTALSASCKYSEESLCTSEIDYKIRVTEFTSLDVQDSIDGSVKIKNHWYKKDNIVYYSNHDEEIEKTKKRMTNKGWFK